MDIEYLRDFIELAKNSSFTKTAYIRNISQPALSKRIAAIEAEFGIKAFDRNNLGTRLEPAGELLLKEAQNIVRTYDAALEHIHSYKMSAPLSLKLGLFKSYKPTDDLLVSALQELRENNRLIDVEKHDIVNPPLEQIRAGVFDMGLLAHPVFPALDDLISVPIVIEPLVAVVHKDHPLASKPTISVKDLDGNVVWTIREGGSLQFALQIEETINRLDSHPSFVPRPWINGSSSYTEIAFVDSGIYITFASVAKFSMPITTRSYKVLRFAEKNMAATVSAVWKKDNTNPACQLLADTMKDIVENTQMSDYWN